VTPAWIAAVCALWALVLLLAFLVLGTLRRVTAVLEQVRVPETPALGAAPTTVVEPFELYDDLGLRVGSDELLVEPATILLFIEPGCTPCLRLTEQLEGVGEYLVGVPIYVVAPKLPPTGEMEFPRGVRILYDRGGRVTGAFSNRATPQAYAVGSNRLVLDRRVPASLDDLTEMASFQRNGGGEGLAEHVSAA
jgi:hypothetical protein